MNNQGGRLEENAEKETYNRTMEKRHKKRKANLSKSRTKWKQETTLSLKKRNNTAAWQREELHRRVDNVISPAV